MLCGPVCPSLHHLPFLLWDLLPLVIRQYLVNQVNPTIQKQLIQMDTATVTRLSINTSTLTG